MLISYQQILLAKQLKLYQQSLLSIQEKFKDFSMKCFSFSLSLTVKLLCNHYRIGNYQKLIGYWFGHKKSGWNKVRKEI